MVNTERDIAERHGARWQATHTAYHQYNFNTLFINFINLSLVRFSFQWKHLKLWRHFWWALATSIFSIIYVNTDINSMWKGLPLHSKYLSSFLNFIVAQVQFSAFPPTPLHPTPAIPTSLPWFQPPLGFVHVPFIVVPENPSPFSPRYPLPFKFLKHSVSSICNKNKAKQNKTITQVLFKQSKSPTVSLIFFLPTVVMFPKTL